MDSPDSRHIRDFDAVGNSPFVWALFADELLAAARILKTQRDRFDRTLLKPGETLPDEARTFSIELMLQAFAIECLLKALRTKRGEKLAVDGKYIGPRHHDLVKLADDLRLPLTPAEKDVLTRLSQKVFTGRYPIPRDWHARTTQKLPSGGEDKLSLWRLPTDDQTVARIIELLCRECDIRFSSQTP